MHFAVAECGFEQREQQHECQKYDGNRRAITGTEELEAFRVHRIDQHLGRFRRPALGQDLTRLLSKMLRIDVDHAAGGKPYGIPPDNPFLECAGVRPETWAYGFRNP